MNVKCIILKDYPTGKELTEICKNNNLRLISLVSSYMSDVYAYFEKLNDANCEDSA